MSNMQGFHNSLSAATQNAGQRQRRLAGLTRTDRARILGATSELQWYLWKEEQDGEPLPQ